MRTPKWDDLDDMLEFINSLVEEEAMVARHTKVTREQEIDWLADNLKKLEKGHHISIVAEIDGKMVGSCGISPMFGRMSRLGSLGVSVKEGYRGNRNRNEPHEGGRETRQLHEAEIYEA